MTRIIDMNNDSMLSKYTIFHHLAYVARWRKIIYLGGSESLLN
jgi:hypothetical protein